MSLEHARGSRGRPTRRQALLTEAELSWATPQRQRIFWTRRNKRRRPAAERLGEVAKSLLGGRELRAALRLGPVRDLWERTVPEALRNHSEVVGLRGGRLMVMVDDPSVRFVFEREIGGALLEAIRAGEGGAVVREINYQIGAIGRDPAYDDPIAS